MSVEPLRMRVDSSFGAEVDGRVAALAESADGRILVGGYKLLGDIDLEGLVRLNVDGTIDSGFRPKVEGSVEAIAVDNQGRIVVGGSFRSVNQQLRSRVARLLSDGTLDREFCPGVDGEVRDAVVLDDGRILLAGSFEQVECKGEVKHRPGIVRLNPDGSLDSSFRPRFAGADLEEWPRLEIKAIAIDANGNYVVGGSFATVNGVACLNIARINPDGEHDAGFRPNPDGSSATDWPYMEVAAIAIESDGSVVFGGDFQSIQGRPVSNFARVLPSGELDRDFNASMDGPVFTLAVLGDAKYFVGGDFKIVGNLDYYMLRGASNATLIQRTGIHFNYPVAADVAFPVLAVLQLRDGSVVFGCEFRDEVHGVLTRLLPDAS